MAMKSVFLSALLICAHSWASGIPLPAEEDRVRIAEAFRLAEAVQEEIWAGWSEVPFVILLVTPEYEYLFRHPYPSEDFVSLGRDGIVGEEILARPFSGNYSTGFMATFPAINGVNTVVIGQPEHTGKTSTPWVITVLHEHFHQLQYTQPWYAESVEALELSGGDTTGMWQLNYPFPYESNTVGPLIDTYRAELLKATNRLREMGTAHIEGCQRALRSLRGQLDAADFRYLSFQLWQEGVARYTEHAVAQAASSLYEPLPAFAGLDDFVPYSEALEQLDDQLGNELENLDPANWKRVIFYPLGAAEALLLDAKGAEWKHNYFSEPLQSGFSRDK
jgi:hypothetical protein